MVTEDELKGYIYGDVYESALQQMQMLQQALTLQVGKGFKTAADCARWAEEHLLSTLVLGKSQHQFFYVTHYGEIVTQKSWLNYYCKDILFWWKVVKGETVVIPWYPDGYVYHDRAKINGEAVDGARQPLYHRDYFTPAGFYEPASGTFNVAKPFPVAAKETGADTSYLYEYIRHVAGECAPWLLTWLRTKMLYPTEKTQVIPIIVSREQGNGKTTFAEVICKGLFGKDNVLVTDQYDSTSRFNADYADALVVSLEEKEETDRRNPAATIKSRATATHIRKENKGLDPIYQESYTEYLMTTNKDVPIKFDDLEQRRFMIMEADNEFTRKKSSLADEVFTKLYGKDAEGRAVGIPFVEDRNVIAQFKHELFEMEPVQLRNFPKTDAYNKCYTIPRTSEAVEIDSILRSLAPFIKATLIESKFVGDVIDPQDITKKITLSSVINMPGALQYVPAALNKPSMAVLCRPLVFYDMHTGKPYQHAVVERCIYDSEPWLLAEYGITIIKDGSPLPGGFMAINSRYKTAPAARFALAAEEVKKPYVPEVVVAPPRNSVNLPLVTAAPRIGERLRVNNKWQPDPEGEYETLNEMKPGVVSLQNKTDNVQYLDTFLFEADETTKTIYMIEEGRKTDRADMLFKERLALQLREAERLYKAGVAARVVYSGGKSYHIIIRIKDSPSNIEERKWLHAHLSTVISTKLTFDPVTYDPARLTRAPITKVRHFKYNDRDVVGTQRLLFENWNNVYDYNWRSQYNMWQNRPLYAFEAQYGRRLVPTKEEYRDAMCALLEGTFWTDSAWNGRRQQCFFPGYRLCRYLGYSHEQLWAESGILDNIGNYYRQSEIGYWKSRESSDIIRRIDEDIDSMEV